METSVELVHLAILKDAATIANRTVMQLGVIGPQRPLAAGERFNPEARKKRSRFVAGEVYRADPIRSRKGGLCLSVDPSVVEGMTDAEVAHLHEIGVEAVKQAIAKNKHLFVGLILGDARKGNNYFDRFLAPGEQKRLF